jgi:cob(I)alamin adenosyltransferase
MGHRLSRIVTRTGDGGTTGLGDGSRVAKDSPRIEAIGAVDELNSTIGVALAESMPPDVRALLTDIQHDLFDLGGELSIPGHVAVTGAHIARIEAAVEQYNADLPMLKEFILPGGGMAAACGHLARTVCRRAEREVIALSRVEDIRNQPQRYLNRLSDLLFVISRVLARASGHGEVLWQHERRRKPSTK